MKRSHSLIIAMLTGQILFAGEPAGKEPDHASVNVTGDAWVFSRLYLHPQLKADPLNTRTLCLPVTQKKSAARMLLAWDGRVVFRLNKNMLLKLSYN